MNTNPRAVDPDAISQQCWDAAEMAQHRKAQAESGDHIAFRLGMIYAAKLLNDRLDPGSDNFMIQYQHASVVCKAAKALQDDAMLFFSDIG